MTQNRRVRDGVAVHPVGWLDYRLPVTVGTERGPRACGRALREADMSRSGMVLSLIVTVAVALAPAALAQDGGQPASVATSWLVRGNATAAGSFLGTTNSQPIIFRTAGKEAMRIVPDGFIGIGTSAPSAPLTVSQNDASQGNGIVATTAGNFAAGLFATGSGNQGYGVYAVSSGTGGVALQGYNTASTGNAGNFYMDNPNIPDSGGDADGGADAVVAVANAGGPGSTLGYYGHAGAFFENNGSNRSSTLYAQSSGANAAVFGYAPTSGVGVKGETYSGVGVWGQSDGEGFVAYFNSTATGGSCVYVGGTGWDCSANDSLMKKHAEAVDPRRVLRQLAAMPVSYYGMVGQRDPAVRYLGPSAEDFKTAFDLGPNDTTINTANAEGVALVAIQGLYRELEARDAKIAALEAENKALKADFGARLAALEQRLGAGSYQAALVPRSQP
jgi:hypothetical protein